MPSLTRRLRLFGSQPDLGRHARDLGELAAEKLPENLFGELFHIGGIAPSAAREFTEYIFG